MTPTDVTPEAAVRASDIVVLGVPSDKYKLPVDWVRAGAIIVNVASHKNIDEAALLAAPSARGVRYVPLVGKVTVAMLERNLLRLYEGYHAPRRARRGTRATARTSPSSRSSSTSSSASRARRSRSPRSPPRPATSSASATCWGRARREDEGQRAPARRFLSGESLSGRSPLPALSARLSASLASSPDLGGGTRPLPPLATGGRRGPTAGLAPPLANTCDGGKRAKERAAAGGRGHARA